MFPKKKDQLDFHVLLTLASTSRYTGDDFKGIVALFEDLDKMVANCKQFNSMNANFQIWRCADMMEMAIFDLKRDLAEQHNIPCLIFAAEQSEISRKQKEDKEEDEL